jgi:hypothetical protein
LFKIQSSKKFGKTEKCKKEGKRWKGVGKSSLAGSTWQIIITMFLYMIYFFIEKIKTILLV